VFFFPNDVEWKHYFYFNRELSLIENDFEFYFVDERIEKPEMGGIVCKWYD